MVKNLTFLNQIFLHQIALLHLRQLKTLIVNEMEFHEVSQRNVKEMEFHEVSNRDKFKQS